MVTRSRRTSRARRSCGGGDPGRRARARGCPRGGGGGGRGGRPAGGGGGGPPPPPTGPGRSSRTGSTPSDYDRPETIEETADLVTDLGGTGIAAVVDHLDSDQVEGLAGRIRREHGHIDVLVNDIWGAEMLKGGPAEWNT